MNTRAAMAVATLLLTTTFAPCLAQNGASGYTPAEPLQSLAKALSGKWALQVRFEAAPSTGNKVIEGTGEELWSSGPGGIDLIEQEHFPSPNGDTYLMGLVWFDATRKQLAGMECNSYLPFTCDLKGGLNDITITWDGKKFQIDELETHDGKRTVWHEYWTNITARSFDQTGDVTQPDGTTTRFMTVHGRRVDKLKTLGTSSLSKSGDAPLTHRAGLGRAPSASH